MIAKAMMTHDEYEHQLLVAAAELHDAHKALDELGAPRTNGRGEAFPILNRFAYWVMVYGVVEMRRRWTLAATADPDDIVTGVPRRMPQ